jgi:hypothetical protein
MNALASEKACRQTFLAFLGYDNEGIIAGASARRATGSIAQSFNLMPMRGKALTLALSQRERGLNTGALSQRERGLNTEPSPKGRGD